MVRVVYQLLERLPYEPQSRHRALREGDDNLWGWDAYTRALTAVVEELRALQNITLPLLAGVKKSELQDITPFEGRPGYTVSASKAPKTIGDALSVLGVEPRPQ